LLVFFCFSRKEKRVYARAPSRDGLFSFVSRIIAIEIEILSTEIKDVIPGIDERARAGIVREDLVLVGAVAALKRYGTIRRGQTVAVLLALDHDPSHLAIQIHIRRGHFYQE
jgi:hypothetical protein